MYSCIVGDLSTVGYFCIVCLIKKKQYLSVVVRQDSFAPDNS